MRLLAVLHQSKDFVSVKKRKETKIYHFIIFTFDQKTYSVCFTTLVGISSGP